MKHKEVQGLTLSVNSSSNYEIQAFGKQVKVLFICGGGLIMLSD